MSVIVVPFKEEHFDPANFGPRELTVLTSFGEPRLLALAEISRCYTIFCDDKIITFGGLCQLWSGTVECWQMPSEVVLKKSVTFAKSVRSFLNHLMDSHEGLQRAQTVCINDSLHRRWMEFLGFNLECVMALYKDSKDYCIYSRVGKWA